jgi:hypothetical protein
MGFLPFAPALASALSAKRSFRDNIFVGSCLIGGAIGFVASFSLAF